MPIGGLVLLAPLAALVVRREWRKAALGGLVVLAVALSAAINLR